MDLGEAIMKQTDVSLALAGYISSTEANNSNLVFSPLSLHVVLSLITSGSSGSTRDQLLDFLKSKSSDHLNTLASELVSLVFADGSPVGGPKLSFANGLWVHKDFPLKPTFKQLVDSVYKSASNKADFVNNAVEVTGEVNLWAEKQTSGLIKEVLPPGSVDSTTRLIFANAIYFRGAWSNKFDASMTKEGDFYLLDGNPVKVPYMTSKKKQFVRAFDGFKVLSLPYKQGEDKCQFSMYFFLPDAKDGLPTLMQKASCEPGFFNKHLPFEKVEVGDFKLPKFKISFGFEASKVLKSLGVELPFSGGGLSEMVDSPLVTNLYVSSIYQKSFIEVNEEGTEAAAASAAVVALRSLRIPQKLDFVADHPLMFVIREDQLGVVLFVGHINNPLVS